MPVFVDQSQFEDQTEVAIAEVSHALPLSRSPHNKLGREKLALALALCQTSAR